MLYREFCSRSIAVHAVHASAGLADGTGERHGQARLLECIIGDPFRPSPTLPAAVLAWNDGTVPRIAQAVYEEPGL
jgi:hypothetical protein